MTRIFIGSFRIIHSNRPKRNALLFIQIAGSAGFNHGWTRMDTDFWAKTKRRGEENARNAKLFNHETHETHEIGHGFGLTQRRRIFTEGNEGNDNIQKAESFYANFTNYR